MAKLVKAQQQTFNSTEIYINYLFKTLRPNERGLVKLREQHIDSALKITSSTKRAEDVPHLLDLYASYIGEQREVDLPRLVAVLELALELKPSQVLPVLEHHDLLNFFPPAGFAGRVAGRLLEAGEADPLQALCGILASRLRLKVDLPALASLKAWAVGASDGISLEWLHKAAEKRRLNLPWSQEELALLAGQEARTDAERKWRKEFKRRASWASEAK